MPPSDAPRAPSLTEQLRRYILQELAALPERSLGEDTPLFESLLDSTSVLALVTYLEESFAIEVRDSEVVPANFSTLRRLAAFVADKSEHAATPFAANR